jgi:hypothetical protein
MRAARAGAITVLAWAASASYAAPGEYRVAATARDARALLAGDAAAWKDAQRVRWGPTGYETEFAALWGTDALYLRFAARDPEPWHTMTKRDEHLWEEEVVEIFLDPGRQGRDYAELEISPANVVCDVRMVQPSPDKKMDLAWNIEGLETRTAVWKARGKDVGWIALARVPFAAFRSLPSTKAVALPPHAGDRWRFNLFRLERPGGKAAPEKGAIAVAWSPTGEPSFHVPAAFRDLVFAAPAGSAAP